MAVLDHQVDELGDGAVDLDGDDVDARDHHLADRLVGHLEDAVDHLLLAVLHHPLLLAEVEHQLELLLGHEGPDHALAAGRGAEERVADAA